jgi:hypothetical protein
MDMNSTPPYALELVLSPDELAAFRFVLREQLAGDVELAREIRAGLVARSSIEDVACRLALVDRLAEAVGGLY